MKFSLLISFLLHLVVLFLNSDPSPSPMQIYLDRGTSVSFQFPKLERMKSVPMGEGLEIKKNQLFDADLAGVKTQDVSDLKNSIQYPPDALHQGLESSCEWRVKVGENGGAEKIELVKPCKYKIFESEFMRVVKNWKFRSPESTWLEVPIIFRIEMEKD